MTPSLTATQVEELQRALATYGILLTPVQVEQILGVEANLVAEIRDVGVDTCVREWAVNVVAHHLGIADRWPLGIDTPAYTKAFFDTFRARAAEKQIALADAFGRGRAEKA